VAPYFRLKWTIGGTNPNYKIDAKAYVTDD
jgi:hypothetical protein